MIDVLLLQKYDWANTGYRFAKCLELAGLNVRVLKGDNHFFNYSTTCEFFSPLSRKETSKYPINCHVPELQDIIDDAKVTFLMHTTMISGVNFNGHKIVVDHGGMTYRDATQKMNEIFNPLVTDTIVHCPDLYGWGAKNEQLIYYPVDTDYLQPDYERKSDKVLIGHFASNPANKGTAKILNAISKLKNDPKYKDRFEYIGINHVHWDSSKKVDWEDNLDRVRCCDVYVETCQLWIRCFQFGEWGNAAIEAAALGKPVITNSLTQQLYRREYGNSGLHIANCETDIVIQLQKFLDMSDKELLKEKKKSREWVVRNHSLKATSNRMMERVFGKFF